MTAFDLRRERNGVPNAALPSWLESAPCASGPKGTRRRALALLPALLLLGACGQRGALFLPEEAEEEEEARGIPPPVSTA